MDKAVTIKLENVSKKYCKNLKKSMLYGLTDVGRNLIGLGSKPDVLRKDEFWAVKDVSFEIKKGEILGIVGPNGSGKTTLLKMLNGIFWPDKGKITVKGKVGALIAVGAGFHNQLSGRENVYINGAILGMSKKEIDEKFDAIVEFADIGDFLDTPVKHYSSGMHVRLGFAIAVHADTDILLVDEILAVGDINFQAKCMEKMKEIRERGTTMVFISHNLNSVQLLCDKAIYLKNGDIQYAGDTKNALNEFKKDALKGRDANVNEVRFGTMDVEIKKVEFLDRDNKAKNTFKRGEPMKVKIGFEAKNPVERPDFNIAFTTEKDVEITQSSTIGHSVYIEKADGYGEIVYDIEALPFNIGKYWVSVSCYHQFGRAAYDHHDKMYQILVEDGALNGNIRDRFGLVSIPAKWEVLQVSGKRKA